MSQQTTTKKPGLYRTISAWIMIVIGVLGGAALLPRKEDEAKALEA